MGGLAVHPARGGGEATEAAVTAGGSARVASHPRRGEIWLTYIPGQPDDVHQPRPALVVSDDIRNRLTDDLIVVPLFSRGRLGPTRVALPSGSGGIDHDSLAFCDEVTTIDRDFLHAGPLGRRIEPTIMNAVVAGIRRAIGETVQ